MADTVNNRIRLVTPAGVVTTLAGSPAANFADGTGAAARFNAPQSVAVIPSSGVIVVADQSNHRIRLVTQGGVVTTLAGNGTTTFADGTGTGATFNFPQGVAVLPNGNIVVADTVNNRIRLVTSAGVVTTLAGQTSTGTTDGTGAAASFNNPRGVAVVPSSGVIIVADDVNNRIRLVSSATYAPASGIVTTMVSGSGTTVFANGLGPTGPALLVAGSSTFAGSVNITNQLGNTGPIPNIPALEVEGDTLVAGNMIVTAGAYSMPSTVAGSVYNTSGFTNTLASLSGATGSYSGPIPASNATVYSFTGGTGTFVVPTGAPMIVDYLIVGGGGSGGQGAGGGGGAGGLVYAKGVQLPAGTYTWTVGAGGAAQAANNTSGSAGSLSSLSNSTFGNVVALGGGAGGGYSSSPAGGAGGSGGGAAGGATVGGNAGGTAAQGFGGGSAASNAAVGGGGGGAGAAGTSGSGGIGLVIPITGSNVYYAGGGGPSSNSGSGNAPPGGLGGGGAGTNGATNVNATSGLANYGGGGGAAGGGGTSTSGAGGSGVVIIRVYTNTGSRLLIGDGSGYSMALSAQSNAVTTDIVTVTDQGNVSVGLCNALFNYVTDAKFDSLGNLYVADATNNRIRKINPAGIVTTVCGNGVASNINGIGTAASIWGPYGIAVDTANNLYVASASGNQILYFNTTTSQLTVIAGSGTATTTNVTSGSGLTAAFNSPRQMAYDPSGTGFLYIAEPFGTGNIRRMTANGATYLTGMTTTTLAATGGVPVSVIFDGVSTLYVGLNSTGYVGRISNIYTTPAASTTFQAVSAGNTIQGVCFDSTKANIYVTTLHSLARFPIAGGTVTTVAGGTSSGAVDATGIAASFNAPQGFALDAAGSNFYIPDAVNNKIRKVNIATSNVTTYAGTGAGGFADGSVPTTTVVNNSLVTSYMGINCNAPLYPLDVNGNSRIVNSTNPNPNSLTTANTNSMLILSNAGTGLTTSNFYMNSIFFTVAGYGGYIGGGLLQGVGSFMSIGGVYNNSNSTPTIHIAAQNAGASNYVGINCNAPAVTLDVSGNAQIGTQLNVGSSSGAALCVGSNITTGSTGAIRMTNSGTPGSNYIQSGSNFTGSTAAPLIFTTMNAGAEWARFDATGKFGINISNPSYTLDVAGTIRTTAGLVFGVQSV